MRGIQTLTRDWYSSIVQQAQAFSRSVTQSLEVGKSQQHIRVLDGMRAVACLLVITFHLNFLALKANLWQPGHGIKNPLEAIALIGESGVILFFLLSGFLLFLPFARAILFDNSWPSVRRYYLRRIFRIIPGYFFALFLIVLFFHTNFFHHERWHDLWLFVTFRMDFQLSQTLNGPFWTLAVEFQFYLLLPLIAWVFGLIARRGCVRWRLSKLTLCLSLLLGWGLLTRYWGMYIVDTPALDGIIPHSISHALKPYLYADTGKFFEVFALGMLLAMLYTYTQYSPGGQHWEEKIRALSPWLLLVGLVGLFFLALGHFLYLSIDQWTLKNVYNLYPFMNPYIPTFYPTWIQWQALAHGIFYALCMCSLLYAPRWLKAPFEWPVLRWIGLISFSLYMWHLPFMFLFLNKIAPDIQTQGWSNKIVYLAFWCWVLIVIFPLSLTLYRWIEKPGMRAGELCIRLLTGANKKPAAATTEPKGPEGIKVQEPVGTAPTGSAL